MRQRVSKPGAKILHRRPADAHGDRDRNAGLHGARASARPERCGSERRHLLARLCALLLQGERTGGDETRLLLGKATPCVGREQELAILSASLDDCIENAQVGAVLIIAPPGAGKSRLRHELLRRLAAKEQDMLLLLGLGAQLSAGSPYGLLRQALSRECSIQIGASPAAQQENLRRRVAERVTAAEIERVSAFIGELCGIAFPDEGHLLLRAARGDPKTMNEQIQRAFIDFLSAECAHRPCLLVLEDLHWGDPLTIKLVDAVLIALREQPLLVLALARPEIGDLFPRLWEGRPVRRISLSGLSKKASARLVTQVLGEGAPAETVARIVEHAAGNALFLEELIRAAAEGREDRPSDTVLAMLQARLSCLDPGARRTLCAASVYGQTFWRGGVLALLGDDHRAQRLDVWLESLLQSESIEQRRESRLPGDVEYGFRHALVRDAAYDLLAAADQEIGNRLACTYLEQAGERDPMVLAEHAHRGADLERAVVFYTRAAEESYRRNDLSGMLVRVDRGLSCGARGEARGKLLALKVEVCLWRGDWEIGSVIAEEALSLLPQGTLWWSKAIGALSVIASSRGNAAQLDLVVQSLLRYEPEADALLPYYMAISSTFGMFAICGIHELANRFVERLRGIDLTTIEHEALVRGHIGFGLYTFYYFIEADPYAAYEHAQRGVVAFEQAQSSRWLNMTVGAEGTAHEWLGDHTAAERSLRGFVAGALSRNDPSEMFAARLHLMLYLGEHSEPDRLEEAAAIARDFIALKMPEPGIGSAYGVLARVLIAQERLSEAQEAAEKALSIVQTTRALRARPYRSLIHALLRQERGEEARRVADEALHFLDSTGGLAAPR